MRDREVDWVAEIQKLGADQVFVQHNPPTPRYGRAQSKLSYLIRDGVFLGSRNIDDLPGRLEIATWTRPPTGRGYGYYACFRLFFQEKQLAAALLYCFYDGMEQSPGFKSHDAAREYATANGFG
jgi:hypothetical protein